MSEFEKWLTVYCEIQDSPSQVSTLKCPNCQQCRIELSCVGDITSRTGYAFLWCADCLHGIHLSRIEIPKGIHMDSFDTPLDQRRIPKLTLIEPT
jgi:hypothetical protein